MGQKVNPTSLRLGITKKWKSRWFSDKHYQRFLEEDHAIRYYIEKNLARSAVESVDITRPGKEIAITIRTARPGLIIGRGGRGLEELQKALRGIVGSLARRRRDSSPSSVKLEIEEIRKPERYAKLVAKNIAGELERRLPFRRVLKQAAEKVIQQKNAEGIKISISGRLGGAEIARTEHVTYGKVPLQTLRADVDYAQVDARTSYGVIGVKVWIYRGEIFDEDAKND